MSGAELERKSEYKGVKIKEVFTIERKGLAAMTSSLFASLGAALGKFDVVHIHAEGPAFFFYTKMVWKESYCNSPWPGLEQSKVG